MGREGEAHDQPKHQQTQIHDVLHTVRCCTHHTHYHLACYYPLDSASQGRIQAALYKGKWRFHPWCHEARRFPVRDLSAGRRDPRQAMVRLDLELAPGWALSVYRDSATDR